MARRFGNGCKVHNPTPTAGDCRASKLASAASPASLCSQQLQCQADQKYSAYIFAQAFAQAPAMRPPVLGSSARGQDTRPHPRFPRQGLLDPALLIFKSPIRGIQLAGIKVQQKDAALRRDQDVDFVHVAVPDLQLVDFLQGFKQAGSERKVSW